MSYHASSLLPTTELYIAGHWRAGHGPVTASHNPADGTVNAEWRMADVTDVDEAVQAADLAWRQTDWAGLYPHQRARVLLNIAQLIESHQEALAQLQRRDNGKPIREARGLVASAAATFRYFAACLESTDEALTAPRGEFLTLSMHQPLGVVAAITPWNAPVASDAQKLAPALAAGNAVVLKPAELTPLVSLALARLCEQAGVPPGVVSVVPGRGSLIGDALVRHPLVRKVTFTGGTEVGRGIARIAAERLIPASLELGGKSPTIVLEDADLDHAVNGVLYGIFGSSGQSCIAGSRLLVQRSVRQDFVGRLIRRAGQLRMGDPADERTQLGPLISEAHRASVEQHVAEALAEGGELLCGGQRPQGGSLAHGYFYPPTVFAGLDNQSALCRQEVFGPVLAILPFEDDNELLAIANDSVFGLAAGIWSRDYQRAWRLAVALQAGTVWINTYKQFSISTPFGGWKDSGLGLEKGRENMRGYQQQKSIFLGLNAAPLAWAD
ncbi:aldehyde dehydrogenase [Frateuria aurantia]|uniref:NAD-dependent aldehyde dehydrogenase n=1 Tax=Frateuria aurantia (strain ATCC 33424 / DSM 6220 / KCTC 2777 / LMG 1558 / NBRC 3245 / NCIMB 13370) TaxID=767434 RepID=H8KZI3_FRAAD|nr:aldehyde dehydrogenase [Frateuria aurantia]AFC86225.1 NAD-dependent aldehyde dehydrogenase [Frateuria aurantia DSM 6220]